MRILFVTYHFPPRNSIGAVRTGKTAKYLRAAGHEVKVVAATSGPASIGQSLEVPRDTIVYVRDPGETLLPGTSGSTASAGTEQPVRSLLRGVRKALYVPDRQVMWFPGALAASRRMLREHRFDVILASAWPVTSLLVARSAAALSGLPWVAELRDLWADNHYSQLASVPAWLDRRLEGVTLRHADALVTVSRECADVLAAKFSAPVAVIYTGHTDETARYAGSDPQPTSRDCLRVVFTGRLYGERRDPSVLFAALELLGDAAAGIEVEFVGPDVGDAQQFAGRYSMQASVRTSPPVPYSEARALQAAADLLLLVLWDQAGEEGVVTGKIFEYMGVRRPILVVGPSGTAAARLVTDLGIGFASSKPEALAAYLSECLTAKARHGRLSFEPYPCFERLSTGFQMERLAGLLSGVAAGAVRSS